MRGQQLPSARSSDPTGHRDVTEVFTLKGLSYTFPQELSFMLFGEIKVQTEERDDFPPSPSFGSCWFDLITGPDLFPAPARVQLCSVIPSR